MCAKSIKRYTGAVVAFGLLFNSIEINADDYCNLGKEKVVIMNDIGEKQYVPPNFCVTVNENEINYILNNDGQKQQTNSIENEIKVEEPKVISSNDKTIIETQAKIVADLSENIENDNGDESLASLVNEDELEKQGYKELSFLLLATFSAFYYLNRRVKNENNN